MAAAARQACMSVGQGETAVVKISREPPTGGMAGPTIGTILPAVRIVILVAGITVGWRAQENIVDMAGRTGYLGMLPG